MLYLLKVDIVLCLDGAVVYQSECYGQGGTGDMAHDALQSDAECAAWAQDRCQSQGYTFVRYLYDENCLSCDEAACDPAWL